jgi:hypothetical protein
MKFLYLAKNNIEAEIIKDKLLQLNIESFFIGSNLHMAIGELPLDALYIKIFVDEDEYQDANKFIEEYIQSFKIDSEEFWLCKKCNEESPKSINLCWKCGCDFF